MKLSRLYTNRPNLFEPIDFQPGLNVILAEIRLPENRDKDTHNLGKSTVGRIIDFVMLADRKPEFFLFKHFDLFSVFVFFLEIELPDGSYATLRRDVAAHSKISLKMVTLHAAIIDLERQRAQIRRLQELRAEIRSLTDECTQLQSQIETDVERQNSDRTSLFSAIRLHFNDIVEQVLDRKALLSVAPNKDGHLEFRAEILDSAGNATSADMGHTYRKLLCIAFDLAVLHSHLPDLYPRFVYATVREILTAVCAWEVPEDGVRSHETLERRTGYDIR